MKNTFLAFAIAFLISAAIPQPAAAQFKDWSGCTDKITTSGKTTEVASLRCVPVIFQNVVTAFLMFAGAVALVLIIYSGIKLVTSGGDPKQVQAARQIMTYAIIGTIVIMSSFAIIYFIGYITNSKDCITDINQINTGGCK
ncbi:MAG TPA: hypothetical protein VM077_04565 [Candidatus Limnocylindrales bacterium]|nr:hypothetical protein [Candidatus Limnocylindrales bacterium]